MLFEAVVGISVLSITMITWSALAIKMTYDKATTVGNQLTIDLLKVIESKLKLKDKDYDMVLQMKKDLLDKLDDIN